MIKNPTLLKKRLNAKETEKEQKVVILLSAIMFIVGFIVAGFNYRYQWTSMPTIVIIIASVLFVLSYLMYIEVIRENQFLSRTIEVQENQTVIDTGLYGVIRHPMYAATVVLFLSMPFILGSWLAFFIFLVYPLIIAKRIKNEEEVLEKNLEGYKEYQQKVKYKMIPHVW